MPTIQHSVIAAADRHIPKPHTLSAHDAVSAASRNRFAVTDPITGLLSFSGSWPKYAGDPSSPLPGDVWYDTANDRFRGCLDSGKVTFAVLPD